MTALQQTKCHLFPSTKLWQEKFSANSSDQEFIQFPVNKSMLWVAGRNILSPLPEPNRFTRILFFFRLIFFLSFLQKSTVSAMFKPLTFKVLPFKHMMSQDVYTE